MAVCEEPYCDLGYEEGQQDVVNNIVEVSDLNILILLLGQS